MTRPRKKILIMADDHAYIREALERIVAGLHGCTTLYSAQQPAALFSITQRRQAEADELTVVDIVLPDPQEQLVIEEDHETPLMMVSAQEHGVTASWFVAMKTDQPTEQTGSRMEAAMGQRAAVMELVESLRNAVRYEGREVKLPEQGRATAQDLTALGLTLRQAEVLVLLAEGFANKEIARQLNVSEWTVRHHVSSILERLEVSNRVRAATIAR